MSSFTVQEKVPLLAKDGQSPRRSKLYYVSAALLSAAVVVGVVLVVLWQLGSFDTADSGDVDDDEEVVVTNKYTMRDPAALCNDGTPGVYYLRRTTSDKWIVRFQGGGLCWNAESCADRKIHKAAYMSSKKSPTYWEFDPDGGLLDSNSTRNPDFYDWNAVQMYYCTSDMWMGNAPIPNGEGWVFNGLALVESGLRDLFELHGMGEATEIIITGEGMAVAVPLNYGTRAQAMAAEYGSAKVGGIVDAGWWLNITYPNATTECISEETCPTSEIFNLVLPYINGAESVDPNCLAAYGEAHRCLWSPIVYQIRTIPLLISQNLYDLSMSLGAGAPLGDPVEGTVYWDFTLVMHDTFLETYDLVGVTDTWGSACGFSHALEQAGFYATEVEGKALRDAIYEWWSSWRQGSSSSSSVWYLDDCTALGCNPTCVG